VGIKAVKKSKTFKSSRKKKLKRPFPIYIFRYCEGTDTLVYSAHGLLILNRL